MAQPLILVCRCSATAVILAPSTGEMLVFPLLWGATGGGLLGKVGKITDTIRDTSKVANSGSALANASSSAFKAADNVVAWTPKNKHLLDSTAQRAAKFNTNSFDDIQSVVAEALRSPNAKFMTNNVDDSFRVVIDLGREIGSKGQTSVRVIVGNDGKIWNAFPVNAQ
ncbi:hypothetical protein ACQE3E_07055 [Methylomonas sp. MED-D]|uniref:hypothetical protein n=1 Tax=unclassified Methylomonas TaxID=2608980 RepID=UPI0028A42558|nr:hypothetical protein [Methylomonas sp. MV1]MDT4329330.1 hypothetical protein [Methylomonas sp. MV1]